MGVSTISLFENNKHIEDLKVYLLGENISDDNKDELKKIGDRYGRVIEIIDVPKLNIPPSLLSARWPLSAFTRLFSGQLLPMDIDRILYLDCDTIVSGDISELENIQFADNIAMCVKDCVSAMYKKNIGLSKNSPYFNAGVILLNVEKLRKVDINNEIESYMNKYVKLINYADQDVLNGMFNGKIGILNPKFDVMTIDVVYTHKEIMKLRRPTNFYSKDEIEQAKKNPLIIHFTTNMRVVRPWFSNSNHPLKDEFLKYMKMSPWENVELREMRFNSKESKIIGIIQKFPKGISYSVLGFIHSEFRPRYIRMKVGK
jgi:lipopolysaccharide biosynthesis glycosyltransferase